MTTAINSFGYADLNVGGAISTRWAFIELQTSANVKIIRIPVTDPRVTRVSLDDKKVTYTIGLKGSDSDIAGKLPVVFGKAAFKKLDGDAENVLAVDTFTDAAMSLPDDVLNLTINAGILG